MLREALAGQRIAITGATGFLGTALVERLMRQAGIVDSERRGLWAYYYVLPDALKELSAWLS